MADRVTDVRLAAPAERRSRRRPAAGAARETRRGHAAQPRRPSRQGRRLRQPPGRPRRAEVLATRARPARARCRRISSCTIASCSASPQCIRGRSLSRSRPFPGIGPAKLEAFGRGIVDAVVARPGPASPARSAIRSHDGTGRTSTLATRRRPSSLDAGARIARRPVSQTDRARERVLGADTTTRTRPRSRHVRRPRAC